MKLVGTTAEKQTEVVLSRACHGTTSCSPKRGFQQILQTIWIHPVRACYVNPTKLGNHNFNSNLSMHLFFVVKPSGDFQGQLR